MSSGNAFIGKPAPNFKATAVMPDGQFKDLNLSDYKGKSKSIVLYLWKRDERNLQGYMCTVFHFR